MTIEREALKLALDALEGADQLINGTGTKGGLVYCMDGYYSDCFDVDPINKQMDEAITAIKQALAQQEQEQEPTSGLHTCPYAEEIHGDYETLCACDEERTRQCAQDI